VKTFRNQINLGAINSSIRMMKGNQAGGILGLAVVQILAGFLDLIGVGIIGLVAANSFNQTDSGFTSIALRNLIEFFHFSKMDSSQVSLNLAILGCLILASRTLISVLVTKLIYKKISTVTNSLSDKLIARTYSTEPTFFEARNSQEMAYALTAGLERITIGVIGAVINLISDLSLLIILFTALGIMDPVLAFQTILFFSFVGYIAHRFSTVRASKASAKLAKLTVDGSRYVVGFVSNFREIYVRGSKEYFGQQLHKNRVDSSFEYSDLAFIPYVGKYLLEGAIVLGALILIGSQFLFHSTSEAVGTIAIFLTASSRIAPAVLRVQQGVLQVNSAASFGEKTYEFIRDLNLTESSYATASLELSPVRFTPSVVFNNVEFGYSPKYSFELSAITFTINPGEKLAIIGPSGSGKSTIVDLMMGLLLPTDGAVLLSGLNPRDIVNCFPGKIAYVPQVVQIEPGTIRSNIVYGFDSDSDIDKTIENCLRIAQLTELVYSLPLGLDTIIDERGSNLSGGQRQRLGIARALFTEPALIVLDESTSALDLKMEEEFLAALNDIPGEVTIVLVSHRRTTIREADKILYIEEGHIVKQGNFDEVESYLDYRGFI